VDTKPPQAAGSTFVPQPAEAAVTVGAAPAGFRPWPLPLLVGAVVVVVAVTGWVVFSVMGGGVANTPEAAALRAMQAYADYDGVAILANVTHASLTATDEAGFVKQAADDKTAANGAPALKDVKVSKATIDPANPDAATVKLTELILDPTTGAYKPRNETLALVKRDGKWLVLLY
jgi:hypothetical protein